MIRTPTERRKDHVEASLEVPKRCRQRSEVAIRGTGRRDEPQAQLPQRAVASHVIQVDQQADDFGHGDDGHIHAYVSQSDSLFPPTTAVAGSRIVNR